MKKILFLLVLILPCLISCDQVNVINPDLNELEGWEDSLSGLYGYLGISHELVLVKFREDDYKNYVCVGHRMMQKENGEDTPVKYEESLLGLAYGYYAQPLSNAFPTDSIAIFAQEVMSLCGTTPYLALSDGYYLIDWKWYGIARPCGIYSKDVPKHCFLTTTRWEELTELGTTWSRQEVTKNPFKEVVALHLGHLDMYRGEYEDSYWHVYNPSICTAYVCANDPERRDIYPEVNRPFEEYVQYCDSMYSVYQQCLIDAIEKGDLHQFAQRFVYE